MVVQTKVKVIKNIEVVKNYYKILLSSGQMARLCEPGQFVEIKVADSYDPLLRRPFSIHRIRGKNLEILYEVVGKGTQILSQKKVGEYLDIIGPLGNGFDYQLPITNYQLPILVAGGMGVAPLIFLAEQIKKRNTQYAMHNTLVLIGAKTRNHIFCEKEFKDLGCEVKISTDDGSRGFKGKVTDLLNKVLSSIQYPVSRIYACGPRPMLKEIAALSRRYNMPAQISLEEHMACGIGACLGCVVDTQDGYKQVCKEGPVFNAEEIIW